MLEVKKYESEFVTMDLPVHGWQQKSNGVRVIHLPTGLYTECDIYQSPHKNKRDAIQAINNILDKGNKQ